MYKTIDKTVKYFLIVIISLVVVGCKSKPVKDVRSDRLNTGANASALGGQGGIAGESIGGDAASLLSQRVIYFNYNSSMLKPESEDVIKAHADHLANSPNVKIVLEGHADERGTREYNLALGEDRAKSAMSLMQVLGIASKRIQTISYGEERPVGVGHGESSWSKNRRVEILYQ